MTPHGRPQGRFTDFLANPATAILWWGLPLAAGLLVEFLPLSSLAKTAVWAAALAWMGAGCTLNARRCHRLHCYFSAPILFLGALAALLVGLGITPFGPHAAGYVINTALILALLTFLAEPVWGKYRKS
jgi:hypothetical protein